MSEKDPSNDAKEKAPDLSALSFGPAWARDKPKTHSRPRQGGDQGGGQGGGQSKGGNQHAGRGRGNQKDHSGRPARGGGQYASAGGGRGGRRNDRRDGDARRGHQGDRDGGYQRPPKVEVPEGFKARIMPIEEGLDALAKDITATGRTHSVFDIAWMVLGGLERFHVIFESENQPLYRSKKDHSLWLYEKECLAHFWGKGIVKNYYDEEVVEVDPPKGNFQSVARCGLSGALIGPPNHHAYQKNLLEQYRENFSHMNLDHYKSKIVMEHSEEAVQSWVETMQKQVRWRPKSEQASSSDSSEPAEEVKQDDASQSDNDSGVSSEVAESIESAEPLDEVSAETVATAPSTDETVVILNSRQEVEQHFAGHGFDQEFESGKTMSVLANVPAKMIDPSLFVLLKQTVIEERRYPGKLASILCRQMSGRHLAVFKWKKHLHCGPARPKHVPDDMVMAERPSRLFHWVIENPGGQIDKMWKDCLPEDVTDEIRHAWYHDLHWLINEGIVLLFSDGKLHAAKELRDKKRPEAQKKKPKAKVEPEKSKSSAEKSVLKVADDDTLEGVAEMLEAEVAKGAEVVLGEAKPIDEKESPSERGSTE